MKQKLFFLILALTACLTAQAYDFKVGDLCYNITSDTEPYTVEVAEYNDYLGVEVIEIPETVENGGKTYSVTSIGSGAFYDCSGLTSVTIPNSVTSIGYWAFYGCSGLTSVNIPESVTSIGSSAFSGVRHINYNGSATNEYNNNWGAYSINGITDGDFVYSNAKKDTLVAYIGTGGNVTIPSSVTSIGSSAFSDCRGLTSINIPESVTSIGNWAFYGCSELTSVNIPNSVTSIGEYAFYGCSGLTSINIPESVTSIGECAFYGCSGLTSVTIPDSVTSIGEYAFYGCSGLTSVNIPSSVTSIGSYAFYDCRGLTSVDIPSSVTSIGYWAFYGCSGLTSIDIPNSVTSIGSYAFYYCSGLTSVTIPNSVTSIGNEAFEYCSGLTSVTIPNSVTSIGDCAFRSCSNLTIRCEASSQPDGWSDFWNNENRPVVWGYVGISEAIASNVKIYAHHNVIVVENADTDIYVYDATGRCVARRNVAHDASTEIAMPHQGLYIVKVGKTAKKVVVDFN